MIFWLLLISLLGCFVVAAAADLNMFQTGALFVTVVLAVALLYASSDLLYHGLSILVTVFAFAMICVFIAMAYIILVKMGRRSDWSDAMEKVCQLFASDETCEYLFGTMGEVYDKVVKKARKQSQDVFGFKLPDEL